MVQRRLETSRGPVTLPVTADLAAGTPVRIGTLNGVTLTKEGSGVGNVDGEATVAIEGSFMVSVAGAATGVKGDPVYINAGALTVVASGGTLWGALMQAKAANTQTVEVMILN